MKNGMILKLFSISLICLFICLSGCLENESVIKTGKVINLVPDVIVGGTFTDWWDFFYFEDGSIFEVANDGYGVVRLNETGRYEFSVHYYEHYKYYKVKSIVYFDD